MPLYEYECDTCGHRFEVIQKFSDEPLAACPKCQGSVRKLLSSPAIQFKGSGWYITDYAKKSGTGTGTGTNKGSDGGDKPAGSTAAGDASSSSAAAAPSKPTTPST